MPVSSKKKRITPASDASTVEPSPSMLPGQQEFHFYLRTLAQSAVRTVIEAVMREELDAFIGVAWGECSPKRKGYRNGSYLRDLVTSTGRLEDIKVPRDRESQFHTQTFERYSRYEPHKAMHQHIQTTNAIESLFSNVRQRTDQIDVFTTETSCLAIVWVTIQDIRLHKISL